MRLPGAQALPPWSGVASSTTHGIDRLVRGAEVRDGLAGGNDGQLADRRPAAVAPTRLRRRRQRAPRSSRRAVSTATFRPWSISALDRQCARAAIAPAAKAPSTKARSARSASSVPASGWWSTVSSGATRSGQRSAAARPSTSSNATPQALRARALADTNRAELDRPGGDEDLAAAIGLELAPAVQRRLREPDVPLVRDTRAGRCATCRGSSRARDRPRTDRGAARRGRLGRARGPPRRR